MFHYVSLFLQFNHQLSGFPTRQSPAQKTGTSVSAQEISEGVAHPTRWSDGPPRPTSRSVAGWPAKCCCASPCFSATLLRGALERWMNLVSRPALNHYTSIFQIEGEEWCLTKNTSISQPSQRLRSESIWSGLRRKLDCWPALSNLRRFPGSANTIFPNLSRSMIPSAFRTSRPNSETMRWCTGPAESLADGLSLSQSHDFAIIILIKIQIINI